LGLPDILDRIGRAGLPDRVAARATRLFERLGRVEAEIHQVPVERVRFHEAAALDAIVDIVGAVWALDWLGVDRITASPLNTGSGTVATAHGCLPVPAPATIRLLEGAPAYSSGTEGELLTPTGALLVTGHASAFGPLPAMTVRRSGYGAGQRDVPGHPNVLRAVLGDGAASAERGRVLVLECNIDDMNPQFYGTLIARLLAAGALDAYFAAVQMKKARPGTLVTVLAPVAARDTIVDVLFRETTTIGIRYHESDRECLSREWTTVTTRFGPVRIKVARRGGVVMNAAPEYDDCAALAAERGAAVREVHAAAIQAYRHDTEEHTGHER
jgi:pyridinium-3,5-bisthiocarboxylic acid mononucleotide nickel chelatase